MRSARFGKSRMPDCGTLRQKSFSLKSLTCLSARPSMTRARTGCALLGGSMRKSLMAAASLAMLLQACSSRPREFTPTLGIAPSDQSKFDAAYAECKQLFVTGKLDTNGRLASGGAGAAAGGAVGLAGGAAAASAGLWGATAVMSATLVLMPVAVIGGAIGMAKVKRHRKEAAIQRTMSGCLRDRGYQIASWQKAPKTRPEKLGPVSSPNAGSAN